MALDWSIIGLDHVRHACSLYDAHEATPSHPPRNTFLLLHGKRYPAKFIRGLSFRLATGGEPGVYHGGAETVAFFARLGLRTEYRGEAQTAPPTGSARPKAAEPDAASRTTSTQGQRSSPLGVRAEPPPAEVCDRLLRPPTTYGLSELRIDRTAVPARPGIYAWWFKESPPSVPVEGAVLWNEMRLLYVGISPSSSRSKNNLRKRIVRSHFTGNASGSTLRLTLGCLMAERLKLRLRATGSTGRLTFGEGEEKLTEWMSENARVSWIECAEPWIVEPKVIRSLYLPLNLKDNGHCAFAAVLSALRSHHKAAARPKRSGSCG